ncbi:hypothetical protein IMZ48_37870 [Candidatus Bathyarchaeota archaeon]|nr:hypothetical protein [Candidatus Bathyarchaeota archaeon]
MAIANREYPVPEHVDIYLLNEGAPPSELGALEWVVTEAEAELKRLEDQAERLLETDGPESPILMDLYDVRLPFPPSACLLSSALPAFQCFSIVGMTSSMSDRKLTFH